jgi:hypothetical protein
MFSRFEESLNLDLRREKSLQKAVWWISSPSTRDVNGVFETPIAVAQI